MKTRFTLLVLLSLFILTDLSAQQMFGYMRDAIDESSPTTMYQIDPGTGDTLKRIGTGTTVGQITAVCFDYTTGAMYTSHGGGGCCPVGGYTACLMDGDTSTGLVNVLGCDPVFGGNDNVPGLTVSSTGEMYGVLNAGNAGPADDGLYLVKMNKSTGAITLKDTLDVWYYGCFGNGLEFGPGDSLYYYNFDKGFGWVDTATSAFTPIGHTFTGFPILVERGITDMAWDPVAEIMYATVAALPDSNYLATINLNTGEITHVGKFPGRINSIAVWNTNNIYTVTNEEICNSYTLFEGDTVSMTGTYTDTLTSSGGRDSIIVLNLISDSADYSVTSTPSSITAVETGAMYQWYDCDGDTIIPGATAQTFYPTVVPGSYACIVTQGACMDTTVCTTVTVLSSTDQLDPSSIELYPNPASDRVMVKWKGGQDRLGLKLWDLLGQEIKGMHMNGDQVDVSDLRPGIYLFEFSYGEQRLIRKLVKE